jgi:transcriptional regulator with XRE-family HTH domain
VACFYGNHVRYYGHNCYVLFNKVNAFEEEEEPTFISWLERHMRMRKITQRQLAVRTGIDHSTISRLKKNRNPSLATVQKLTDFFGDSDFLSNGNANPVRKVEHALRADPALSEAQIREIMQFYFRVRNPIK